MTKSGPIFPFLRRVFKDSITFLIQFAKFGDDLEQGIIEGAVKIN